MNNLDESPSEYIEREQKRRLQARYVSLDEINEYKDVFQSIMQIDQKMIESTVWACGTDHMIKKFISSHSDPVDFYMSLDPKNAESFFKMLYKKHSFGDHIKLSAHVYKIMDFFVFCRRRNINIQQVHSMTNNEINDLLNEYNNSLIQWF